MKTAPSRPRSFPALVVAVVAIGLAVAGTAGAFFLRSRRDVTTSSEQAAKLYHEALENDLKVYEREAISGYAAALQLDPHFVMATLHLADKLRARDPERARSLLASAARYRDEITPREQLILRIFEERWGRHDVQALGALYDEYLRRFPADPEAYRMHAGYLESVNRLADAIAEYERLLTVNPNYAYAYNALGYYWMSKGDVAKAEDFLKRYRYLAPDQANPFDSLGELYARTGRYDEAEENLQRALKVKEDFVAAYGHLGTVEIGRGHPEKAAAWFRKAANASNIPGERMQLRFFVVMALFDAGRRDEARAEFESMANEHKALPPGGETNQREEDMRFLRTIFLARMGDATGAEASLRTAMAATPGPDESPGKAKARETTLLFLRGVLAGTAGRFEEGARLLSAALESAPANLDGHDYYEMRDSARLLLSECLRRLGRPEEAEKALAPLLARNPRFQPALDSLARLHSSGAPTAQARTKPSAGGAS